MLSFDEFKRGLERAAVEYSDAEIQEMRDLHERLANLMFDWWIEERKRRAGLAESCKERTLEGHGG